MVSKIVNQTQTQSTKIKQNKKRQKHLLSHSYTDKPPWLRHITSTSMGTQHNDTTTSCQMIYRSTIDRS